MLHLRAQEVRTRSAGKALRCVRVPDLDFPAAQPASIQADVSSDAFGRALEGPPGDTQGTEGPGNIRKAGAETER